MAPTLDVLALFPTSMLSCVCCCCRMHHSSPSPDSSAQQSPDTGSPATPGTRQHSLTVASPPILNCAGVLNNPSTPTAPNINIPMQVHTHTSLTYTRATPTLRWGATRPNIHLAEKQKVPLGRKKRFHLAKKGFT